MTATADAPRAGAPWHYWLVAVLGLLWNAFGGYDYWMSQTAGDAYLRSSGMNDAQVAYFHAMPVWTTAVWALGVWGAVAGSLLLLFRSRWAFHAFAASLIGLLASLAYTHLLSDGGKLMGQKGLIMNGVILVGCLVFVWYAQLMTKRGVLR